MKFSIVILLLCLTTSIQSSGVLESIADVVSSVVGAGEKERPEVAADLDTEFDDILKPEDDIVALPSLEPNFTLIFSNTTSEDFQASVELESPQPSTPGSSGNETSITVDNDVKSDQGGEQEAAADTSPTDDTGPGADDADQPGAVVSVTEPEESSVLDKVKSVISEVFDYLPGGGKVDSEAPISEKPSTVEEVNDDIKESEDIEKVSSSNGTCILSCTADTFFMTLTPKKQTTEETDEKISFDCRADFKDDAYHQLTVEFEWIYTAPEGTTCSLGPIRNHEYCDGNKFSFSSEAFMGENAFVSELHLFGVMSNHTGTFSCQFQAVCCLPFGDDNDVDILTIERSSELFVFNRPDYTYHLALAAAITAVLCLSLCLAVFLYFRLGRKVRSNVQDLDKSNVKYKQMQMMTPPVMLVEDNFYSITDDDNRDSYTSFDSVGTSREAEA